jgi:hypothetical protein
MSDIYINLQTKTEPEPTGTVMLSVDDYTVVPIGSLSEMLDEIIEHNTACSGTPDECIDRDTAAMLAPLLDLLTDFIQRVEKLRAACTPEIQADLDATCGAIHEL